MREDVTELGAVLAGDAEGRASDRRDHDASTPPAWRSRIRDRTRGAERRDELELPDARALAPLGLATRARRVMDGRWCTSSSRRRTRGARGVLEVALRLEVPGLGGAGRVPHARRGEPGGAIYRTLTTRRLAGRSSTSAPTTSTPRSPRSRELGGSADDKQPIPTHRLVRALQGHRGQSFSLFQSRRVGAGARRGLDASSRAGSKRSSSGAGAPRIAPRRARRRPGRARCRGRSSRPRPRRRSWPGTRPDERQAVRGRCRRSRPSGADPRRAADQFGDEPLEVRLDQRASSLRPR